MTETAFSDMDWIELAQNYISGWILQCQSELSDSV